MPFKISSSCPGPGQMKVRLGSGEGQEGQVRLGPAQRTQNSRFGPIYHKL